MCGIAGYSLSDASRLDRTLGPAPDAEAVDDAVLELVLSLGGSVSAEHGIGIAKVRWLVRDRGPETVAAMRAIKDAWDPAGILNPGVLFAPDPDS